MTTISNQNFTELYSQLIRTIYQHGQIEAKTKEITGVFLQLYEPQQSLLCLPKNWAWAFQETIDRFGAYYGYPKVSNPGKAYRYRPNWAKKLEKEGGEFDYAYGTIFGAQLDSLIKELKFKATREAILTVWDYKHLVFKKDYERRPCTLNLHFIIRDEFLHCYVYMRSNDVINLLPYDVFSHTFLQRFIAHKLKLSLGNYNHIVTHAYYHKRREQPDRNYIQKLISQFDREWGSSHTPPFKSRDIDKDFQLIFDNYFNFDKDFYRDIDCPLLQQMVKYLFSIEAGHSKLNEIPFQES